MFEAHPDHSCLGWFGYLFICFSQRPGSVFFFFFPLDTRQFFLVKETRTIYPARAQISTLHAVRTVTEAPGKWIFSCYRRQHKQRGRKEANGAKPIYVLDVCQANHLRARMCVITEVMPNSVRRVGETTGVRGLGSAWGGECRREGSHRSFHPSERGIPSARASASCPSKEARQAPLLPQGRKHEPAALCDSRNDPRSKASTRSAGFRGPSGEF